MWKSGLSCWHQLTACRSECSMCQPTNITSWAIQLPIEYPVLQAAYPAIVTTGLSMFLRRKLIGWVGIQCFNVRIQI